MEISSLNEYLQLITHIVTILGLPLALFIFYQEKVKERREREYGTYNALDDKYIHFLELCLERPELDVFDAAIDSNSKDALDVAERQEQILFLILISILERAYLMYREQDTEIKRCQWTGWVEYMKDYCSRPNFRQQWPHLGPQFDSDFVSFMNKLIGEGSDQKTE